MSTPPSVPLYHGYYVSKVQVGVIKPSCFCTEHEIFSISEKTESTCQKKCMIKLKRKTRVCLNH